MVEMRLARVKMRTCKDVEKHDDGEDDDYDDYDDDNDDDDDAMTDYSDDDQKGSRSILVLETLTDRPLSSHFPQTDHLPNLHNYNNDDVRHNHFKSLPIL